MILVACAVLLTLSFAGAGSSGSIGRGFSSVGDIASGSLKPARDLRDWVSATWDAKGSNDDLAADRNRRRRENIALQAALRKTKTSAAIARTIDSAGLDSLGPVRARVILTGGTRLYDQVTINKGSASGLRVEQPVVTAGGIVGKVDAVTAETARISLLTSKGLGIQARVRGTDIVGAVSRMGNNPLDLLFRATDPRADVRVGAVLITRGTAPGARLPSIYPPNVAFGQVSRLEQPGSDTQRIHVRPIVDVRTLEHVVVLTRSPR
ncbi:hypothetical protein DSM112329_02959 [Paraconexibacter sp. AEG42_29]|uniref:Cell shape-determining protein MreC n=1 Tax=Paraconexibacter sp. AEG42_29 TaxID=2997339 RepID=A0AAU7AWW3_9ACTN